MIAMALTIGSATTARVLGGIQVTPWPHPFGTGLAVQTDHYLIYTNILDQHLIDQMASIMEAAHRAYNAFLPYPVRPRTRSIIYLFSNRRQWEDYIVCSTGPYADTYLQIDNGAVCHNGQCILYWLGPERTFAAMAHEGWHQFTSRHFALRLPSWLDEGMATIFEGIVAGKNGLSFVPAANIHRLRVLQQACKTGQILPIDQLLVADPGQAMVADSQEYIQLFYAQWYALVRFLLESDQVLFNAFTRLIADAFLGRWPLDVDLRLAAIDRNIPRTIAWNRIVGRLIFKYYIGDPSDELQDRFVRFCNQLARASGPGL